MLQLVTGMDYNDKNLGNMGGTCNRFGDVNFSHPFLIVILHSQEKHKKLFAYLGESSCEGGHLKEILH